MSGAIAFKSELSMTDAELIEASLEALAERVDDLTPQLYSRFFARCPTAEKIFANRMHSVQGRMLNEILQAIVDCAQNKNYIDGLLETQTGDHSAWGVTGPMYREFFAALMDTLQAVMSDVWSGAMRDAWQRQIEMILRIVDRSLIR